MSIEKVAIVTAGGSGMGAAAARIVNSAGHGPKGAALATVRTAQRRAQAS